MKSNLDRKFYVARVPGSGVDGKVEEMMPKSRNVLPPYRREKAERRHHLDLTKRSVKTGSTLYEIFPGYVKKNKKTQKNTSSTFFACWKYTGNRKKKKDPHLIEKSRTPAV